MDEQGITRIVLRIKIRTVRRIGSWLVWDHGAPGLVGTIALRANRQSSSATLKIETRQCCFNRLGNLFQSTITDQDAGASNAKSETQDEGYDSQKEVGRRPTYTEECNGNYA